MAFAALLLKPTALKDKSKYRMDRNQNIASDYLQNTGRCGSVSTHQTSSIRGFMEPIINHLDSCPKLSH